MAVPICLCRKNLRFHGPDRRRLRVVAARSRWSGALDAVACDYDVACDVKDLVGAVPLSDGVGLVLGDEVPMSTWLQSALFSGGVLLVPMHWPEPGHIGGRDQAAICGRQYDDPNAGHKLQCTDTVADIKDGLALPVLEQHVQNSAGGRSILR
jgi:hypothetical protein